MIDHSSSIRLFGMSFARGSAGEVLAEVDAMASDRPRQIVTANIDHVVTLSENETFRQAYAGAAARTLDGMPLVWLARLRGDRRTARVTGHDLLDAALGAPADASRRVFIVCATDATGRAIQRRLEAGGAPRESVVFEVPPLGFEGDAAYGERLARDILRHGTTLLIMGVGAPKSEIWVHRQGPALGNPVVLDVGEALNVAAGLVARAPPWMQRLGIEWLFRFATHPRRLFHRYFVRSWRFFALAVRDVPLAPR